MKKNVYKGKKYNIIKGQAAVELAIFGSLVVLAFSVLIMYGQRLDSQQDVKMAAFRRALQKAYERNGSVSYTYKKEGRNLNLFGAFGRGQPSTVSSTASVMWQKGLSGDMGSDGKKNYAYYRINDYMVGGDTGLPLYPKQVESLNGKKQTVWVPASIYGENTLRTEDFSSSVSKRETTGRITNTATSDLSDTVATNLRVRVDHSYDDNPHDNSVPLPSYTYEGNRYEDDDEGWQTVQPLSQVTLGAYSDGDTNRINYGSDEVGTTVHRTRTWQTSN